jgi:hypothetical protein
MRAASVQIISLEDCESRVRAVSGKRVPLHIQYICSAAEPFALMHSVSFKN